MPMFYVLLTVSNPSNAKSAYCEFQIPDRGLAAPRQWPRAT